MLNGYNCAMRLLSRFFASVMMAAAFFVTGCQTIGPGYRMEARNPNPQHLHACFLAEPDDTLLRMAAVGEYHGIDAGFQSALIVADVESAQGCDIIVKSQGGHVRQALRDIEVYSGYSKKFLLRYRGHNFDGESNSGLILSKNFRPGTLLYQQVMDEAGPSRRALAQHSGALTPGPAPAAAGMTKDELRSMMAAVMNDAKKDDAPAAIVSDVDAPRYKRNENEDYYAVVVGIEKYADLPEARFAERDAQAVYDHLVALGYPSRNIALLRGAAATKTGLIKNIEAWLPQNVNERSTVFFYYSGHGAPDPKAGHAYLVPSDGDPSYLEETTYPVKRLYEKLGALKAKRVLVAMDSCFSGAGGRSVLAKGTRPLVGKVDLGLTGGAVITLSASASDQISSTLEPQGHGLFTYYMLKGLNGDAADSSGKVTVRSLHAYLSPKVRDAAKRQNREQAPQLLPPGLDDRNDIRLR